MEIKHYTMQFIVHKDYSDAVLTRLLAKQIKANAVAIPNVYDWMQFIVQEGTIKEINEAIAGIPESAHKV